MKHLFTVAFFFFCSAVLSGQDGLNQVVVVNGGQFGNPSERSNIAVYDPVSDSYEVVDTLPSNAVQHLLVNGDNAWVAAQNFILRYDLDSYERLAETPFPGLSAHQLFLWEDKLFATNFFGQTSGNLYVFDAEDLTVLDTIAEITHPGGTMTAIGDQLYISQNLKGSIDACPPFGCFNDTMGYLARVDMNTLSWVSDIPLDNDGDECGRIVRNGSLIVSLNEVSNTITVYDPGTGQSQTDPLSDQISTARYRTEALAIAGNVISLFNGGIGVLDENELSVEMVVDTPVIAFDFDQVNGHYYATATDFFSYNSGYAFSATGEFLFDFPTGLAPESIAMHYNRQPVGNSYQAASTDTVWMNVNDIASDPDGDALKATRIIDAPIAGIVNWYADGRVRYVSFSPGSADAFRLEICDEKRNPLCSFIQVSITPTTGIQSGLLDQSQIYPNPVTDRLFIRNGIPGATYRIYDMRGAAVLPGFSEDTPDVSVLPSGLYLLQMQLGQEFKTIRFQKF